MSERSTKANNSIYQIKVTLQGSKPPIWRRLLVPATISLSKLHEIIQIAMGWEDAHMHMFTIDGAHYGAPSPDDWMPMQDESEYQLRRIAPMTGRKFTYEYDFGDSWRHIILVEKILPRVSGVQYPVCIKGKRACPPEDIGGIWGYYDFLEAINDPNHPEHETYMDWYEPGEFDSETFDIDEINAMLKSGL